MKKLKEIPVVNKLMQELERALDVKDKVLAEFVLDIAKKCSSVSEFEKTLAEYDAEFSIELINTIYATVTKMLPEYFKNNKLEKRALEDPEESSGHFIKTKMLEDEPEIPWIGSINKGTEEEKFD